MYCTNCGTQIGDADKFCRECAYETKAGRDANLPGRESAESAQVLPATSKSM
jgi:hypothetical protein